MLVLAGVELPFFPVTGTDLCFGFALNIWLIIGMLDNRCDRDVLVIAEQYLHRAEAFSVFHTTRLMRRIGGCGRLGADTAGTSDQRDIPDHRTPCSGYKEGGRR